MYGRGKISLTAKVAGILSFCFYPLLSLAAPWDLDMYKQQSFKANEIARAPVKNTHPVGSETFPATMDEAEKNLVNPVAFTLDSVWRGQRLYNSNCFTCHGKKGDGQGVVGLQLKTPNILDSMYKSKSDGRVFAAVQLGFGNMPRYGYKFSGAEIWDMVNYVRFLQGREMSGLTRP